MSSHASFNSKIQSAFLRRSALPPEVSQVQHTYSSGKSSTGKSFHLSEDQFDSRTKSYESPAYYELQFNRQQQPDFTKTRSNTYRPWSNAELTNGRTFVTPKRPFQTT